MEFLEHVALVKGILKTTIVSLEINHKLITVKWNTAYPTRIIQRHSTSLHVLSHQSSEGRSEWTQELSSNGSIVQNLLSFAVLQCSPLLPIFRALSSSLHRHSSDTNAHLTPSNIQTTEPRSTPCPPSTYFRHQHRSSYTLLIHSSYVSKLPILSTRQLTFIRALISTFSFLTLSIRVTPNKVLRHYI